MSKLTTQQANYCPWCGYYKGEYIDCLQCGQLFSIPVPVDSENHTHRWDTKKHPASYRGPFTCEVCGVTYKYRKIDRKLSQLENRGAWIEELKVDNPMVSPLKLNKPTEKTNADI